MIGAIEAIGAPSRSSGWADARPFIAGPRGWVVAAESAIPEPVDNTDPGALPEVSPTLYRQLRVLARARLRHGGRNTVIDTTALVHEALMRMGGMQATEQEARRLLAYASRTMRSVIVDAARRRQAQCRGGEACIVTYTEAHAERSPAAADHVVRVHDALLELAGFDPALAQVVEMRFFAGLSDVEIGRALDISERTVRRHWDKARVLLAQALRD